VSARSSPTSRTSSREASSERLRLPFEEEPLDQTVTREAMRRLALKRCEKGQALVEFALVAPLLLLLLFAIVQIGIAYKNSLALADAVRAGARAAVVSGRDGAAAAAEQAVLASAPNLDQTELEDGITVNVGATAVTVNATYPYSIDLLGIVVKSGSLSSSTTEEIE
jgi:Flp pilus assembly protein TadG